MLKTRFAAACFGFAIASLIASCATSGSRNFGEPDVAWLTHAQEPSSGAQQEPSSEKQEEVEEPEEKERGLLFGILLYLPNRLFDVLDIARLRLRVGPGLSAGVRATRPLTLALGAHEALYLGLHGPRGHATIPWPIGFEGFAGAEISV